MSIPGNAEPGAFSGQQQVQHQPSVNFSSAIPIKKRRFPIIWPPSPPPEEKIPNSEEQEESKIPDEERSYVIDARNTSSSLLDVRKTSALIAEKEVTPKNMELGQANVDIFASKSQGAMPTVDLNPVSDFENKSDIISKEKSSDREERSFFIDARNLSSPGNSDVSKTIALIIKKEVSLNNIRLGEANVDIFASKPQEAKPTVSLTPVFDLGNKSDILLKEKSSDLEFEGPQTEYVEQEIFSGPTECTCGLELVTGSMSVELSLGPKELIVPPLESKEIQAICIRSDKSDPSLLSLALSDENLVLPEKSDSTVDDVGSRECTIRSNWDLNTTMDAWEGSKNSDAFFHKLADFGGMGKTDSCHDEESSLTTTGTIGFSLNKGNHILDVSGSKSSNVIIQLSQQCQTDLGLRLAMQHSELDARKDHSFLSDNLVSTSASPNLGLQRVQISAANVNRNVKSEPLDEKSERDCSVGSSSSSNMGLLKLSSVKTEFVNNHGRETVLQSSASPNRLFNCKFEYGTLPQSVARLMHQESCASSSSSSSSLLVSLKPQSSCNLRSPSVSELMPSRSLTSDLENCFRNKEFHARNDSMVSTPVGLDEKLLSQCNTRNSSVVDPDNPKLTRVDEDTVKLCQHGEEAKDDDVKINISAEMNEEESFQSDSKSGICAVDNSMGIEENLRDKEDDEYEDGEVREPLQCSAIEEPSDVGKKTENLEFVTWDFQNLQPSDLSGNKDIITSDFDGNDSVKVNREEIYNNTSKVTISISCTSNSEDDPLQKVSDKVLEVGADEKRTISVTPERRFDLLGNKDVEEGSGKEISSGRPTNLNCGIGVELEDGTIDKVVKEICSVENNSTLSKLEDSLNGHDATRDSSNAGSKSRIINLARASVVTSPCKTSSVPNRLLTSRSEKEEYSDLDGEIQPRGNRDEMYTGGGPSKFAKYSVHDQRIRNPRPSFMHGRGRTSSRYGSLRNEWDSDQDFASETSYGPYDYRPVRRKHASDAETECNSYNIQQYGSALGSNNCNRRKATNDEFRLTSLRRFSPVDRDGPPNRRNQTLSRFPRNMSPNRCNDDKFMQHLSDDIMNPVYNHSPEATYDEFDGQGQHLRGNRNFSTLQRRGYPRNRLKSPVRSGTRSPPSPWSSPQHRSPGLYRMERVRSPDRVCFRDEMVSRRRGSPYITRHPNDSRDVDSGRDHIHHPRSANPKRSSPKRVFRRSGRPTNALDSDGDEYMNRPNKFNELRGDGSIDERRKFNERRGQGPVRSFRPGSRGDGENFQFHADDGPRPYRFCPNVDTEFVERGNVIEREYDGRVKHQQGLVVSRRVRNVQEQQQDGNYRPVERVWHDDGFDDGKVKRRKF